MSGFSTFELKVPTDDFGRESLSLGRERAPDEEKYEQNVLLLLLLGSKVASKCHRGIGAALSVERAGTNSSLVFRSLASVPAAATMASTAIKRKSSNRYANSICLARNEMH